MLTYAKECSSAGKRGAAAAEGRGGGGSRGLWEGDKGAEVWESDREMEQEIQGGGRELERYCVFIASIRRHTSAYVSMRQHASAYVGRSSRRLREGGVSCRGFAFLQLAYVSIFN
jgi:hypothetical protein